MCRGYVRDRSALIFTLLIPVIFLALLGSIYKNPSTPKITVLEAGRVSLLDQARAASPALRGTLMITRSTGLAAALAHVRKGDDDAAVQQEGNRLLVHYSAADPTKAGVVRSLFASVVAARIGISLAIALAQMFIFLGIASTSYFGMKLTASWWMAIPVVACGTLAFMSVGLLIGAVARTQQAATSIANLIILPMAFLGGAFVPLDFAPAWLRDVSYAMPLRYLVTGVQNVMARGLGPASALPAIGVLLSLSAVLTAICVRVFRWDEI